MVCRPLVFKRISVQERGFGKKKPSQTIGINSKKQRIRIRIRFNLFDGGNSVNVFPGKVVAGNSSIILSYLDRE